MPNYLMKKFVLIAVALFGLLPASIAKAHDPIILTFDQRTPVDGPLLPDGTISFALYGSLDSRGDTRGFRVNFNEGDVLYLSILIPDLPPENKLGDSSLPYLKMEDPNGATTKIALTEKVSFPEPFTGTNYVRLTELLSVAVSGTYSVTITGDAPTRFTVSVGQKEMFGTAVENVPNRDLGVAGVMEWYSASPLANLVDESTTLPPADETAPAETPTDQENSGPGRGALYILVAVLVVLVVGRAAKVKRDRK